MKLPLEFTGNYWLFMVRFWVRKSGDNGGNLDPNDQSRSGRSVTTTHDLNRHIVFELIQKKIDEFLRQPLQRIKHWFGSCQILLQVWVTSDHTLMLPLERRQRTSDFKLFHILPTDRIWHHLTLGCFQVSRNIS